MGLFKEIHCACCGKKTNLIQRTRLKDDQYVCSECTANIPGYIKSGLGKYYTYEQFTKLKEYIEYSNRYLALKFRETHYYETVHLDAVNGIMYYDHGITAKPLYLEIKNVETFELDFTPETYKEGVFTEKVKGDVKMHMACQNPIFDFTETIRYGAKGDARLKKGLFKDKLEYENPKGMDDLVAAFLQAKTEVLLRESENIMRQVNDALR